MALPAVANGPPASMATAQVVKEKTYSKVLQASPPAQQKKVTAAPQSMARVIVVPQAKVARTPSAQQKKTTAAPQSMAMAAAPQAVLGKTPPPQQKTTAAEVMVTVVARTPPAQEKKTTSAEVARTPPAEVARTPPYQYIVRTFVTTPA